MSAGHTPGPWEAESDLSVWALGGGIKVAGACGTGGGLTAEDHANARLIAAAPELLTALRELRDECDAAQGPELRQCGSAWRALMESADAAIAKAEGR